MAHVQAVEGLVREYLCSRGFVSALKALETEVRADRDRGYRELRVDRLVEQIAQSIHTHDLMALRELWANLDSHVFTKLEEHFTPAIKKIETSILKLYVVTAVSAGKMDKVLDFLSKITPEIQSQPEWKDWFMIPYINKPEENPLFVVYFTRQWQDTLMISLHNFLATIFQCMPQPTLASYEAEASLLHKLQEENTALKQKVLQLESGTASGHQSRLTQHTEKTNAPTPLIDDFYIIPTENSEGAIREPRGFRGFIRQMGGSPVLGKKQIRSLSQN